MADGSSLNKGAHILPPKRIRGATMTGAPLELIRCWSRIMPLSAVSDTSQAVEQAWTGGVHKKIGF